MTASTDTPAIEIPIIDIAGYLAGDEAATLRAANQLRLALEKVGFFMISGHGVDWALVDKAYGGAERFFAQPVEVKERIGVPTFYDLKERLGYVGFAGEVRSGRTVDARVHLVEAFYFTAETDEAPSPRNNWPADLPGFRADLLAYFNAVQSLGLRLLPLFARALDLPGDYFQRYFEREDGQKAPAATRLAHYPPRDQQLARQGVEAPREAQRAHSDFSFLTILPANKVMGLEIHPEDSDWVTAPCVPETFVVNSGDVLRRWSNDRVLSTIHRVVTPEADRYSIPFFYVPFPDDVLDPLPSCVDAERPARYAPFTFGGYNREKHMNPEYRPEDARVRVLYNADTAAT